MTLVFAELIVIVLYLVFSYVYPMAIQLGWVDTIKWFDVKRGCRSNTITYSQRPLFRQKHFTIQYIGGLDEYFRPHGFGVWKDNANHGETLVGEGEHGLPVGLFASQERESARTTRRVRIAYSSFCPARDESSTDSTPLLPADEALRWGVASVECSEAETQSSRLPPVEYLAHSPSSPRIVADCLNSLRTPFTNIVYKDLETQTVFDPCTTPFRETLVPATLSELERESRPEPEAVVFIHGRSSCVEDALKTCASVLIKGKFPSHIQTFVFSWPAEDSGLQAYWRVRRTADSPEVALALLHTLRRILDAGVTKVHFVAQEMGARVLLNTFERHHFDSLFRYGTRQDSSATIESVSLWSPEFPLPRFVAAAGAFDVLHQYCSLVTIYGDNGDFGLRCSEVLNRDMDLCGPRLRSLGCNVAAIPRDESFHRLRSSIGDVDVGPRPQSTETDLTIVVVNQTAGFSGVTDVALSETFALSTTTVKNYGSFDHDFEDGEEDKLPSIYLDVDVVDMSSTRTTMTNRFSLIASDLREVIKTQRRARARRRLVRQRGNVFLLLDAEHDV